MTDNLQPSTPHRILRRLLCCAAVLGGSCALMGAQEAGGGATPVPGNAPSAGPQMPQRASAATVTGLITDTDDAAVPGARVLLEDASSKVLRTTETDPAGAFSFAQVAAGRYNIRITARGFAAWKVENVVLASDQNLALPTVALGVEAVSASVDAITIEDLAEEQISAEEKQRILGILPNFYVSYVANPAPLTRRQKFKLAERVSIDPLTFITTGVSAGIEQAQGSLSGYGPGLPGYASRYGATYGDRLSSTFFGAALFPALFHQDPRYFYKGTGGVVHRAFYAISTVVICKGDNGHWQPNYSNVLGNLAAGGIATLYYPRTDRHSLQVTVDNDLIGTATGAIGTLFQEFLLRHFTHGAPARTPRGHAGH